MYRHLSINLFYMLSKLDKNGDGKYKVKTLDKWIGRIKNIIIDKKLYYITYCAVKEKKINVVFIFLIDSD